MIKHIMASSGIIQGVVYVLVSFEVARDRRGICFLFLHIFFCSEIICPDLPPPAFGRVSIHNNRTLSSVATYSCNHGYAVVGEATRYCLVSEQWSGKEPKCTGEGACVRIKKKDPIMDKLSSAF